MIAHLGGLRRYCTGRSGRASTLLMLTYVSSLLLSWAHGHTWAHMGTHGHTWAHRLSAHRGLQGRHEFHDRLFFQGHRRIDLDTAINCNSKPQETSGFRLPASGFILGHAQRGWAGHTTYIRTKSGPDSREGHLNVRRNNTYFDHDSSMRLTGIAVEDFRNHSIAPAPQ